MINSLVSHLAKADGVEGSDDILVVSFFKEQHRLLSDKITSARAATVLIPNPRDQSAPSDISVLSSPKKWVIVAFTSPAILSDSMQHVQPALSRIFSDQQQLIVTLPSTFIRCIDSSSAEDTPMILRWKACLEKIRASKFKVSGTSTFVKSRVGNYLPVNCSRHPTVRGDVEQVEEIDIGKMVSCPYPCLSTYANCSNSNHVCVLGCHSVAQESHEQCGYLNPIRLPCGHTNVTTCHEEYSCGNTRQVEMPCSHEDISGWDSTLFQIKYKTVRHNLTLPCTKETNTLIDTGKISEIPCTADYVAVCETCGGRTQIECKDKSTFDCPKCYALRNALYNKVKAELSAKRREQKAENEKQSMHMRMRQVDASRKSIFVEGQKVRVEDPTLFQNPGDFITTFGERTWLSTQNHMPVHGTIGTVRGRAIHPKDFSTTVYLIEAQGQEYFIINGKGLMLYSAVAQIASGQQNTLLITAGAAPELPIGSWGIYYPKDVEKKGNILTIEKLQKEGIQYYSDDNPPSINSIFTVIEKVPHPDGSVEVDVLEEQQTKSILHMEKQTAAGNFKIPFQKGQKILIRAPERVIHPDSAMRAFPSIKKWYVGCVRRQDSGMVMGIYHHDPSNLSTYSYVVKHDVRQTNIAIEYRGLELDHEAEQTRKDDKVFFKDLDILAEQEWEAQQPTAREVIKQQLEAEAKHKEETKAVLMALELKAKKATESKHLSAAERAKKETDMTRLRDDARTKLRRLERSIEDRNTADVEMMESHRSSTKTEVDILQKMENDKLVADDNTTLVAAAPQQTDVDDSYAVPEFQPSNAGRPSYGSSSSAAATPQRPAQSPGYTAAGGGSAHYGAQGYNNNSSGLYPDPTAVARQAAANAAAFFERSATSQQQPQPADSYTAYQQQQQQWQQQQQQQQQQGYQAAYGYHHGYPPVPTTGYNQLPANHPYLYFQQFQQRK
eukprot:TRINITY_DN2213_c1_g1_i3.p1 TRINITY_DN2213_c1_g1~~TRINITY_DN2213_c1_g1_i3.p1  ORF type:complete len:950 (+),score=182.60 TRINITY_DN2213_c1_g1_i3:417-3266(+)